MALRKYNLQSQFEEEKKGVSRIVFCLSASLIYWVERAQILRLIGVFFGSRRLTSHSFDSGETSEILQLFRVPAD